MEQKHKIDTQLQITNLSSKCFCIDYWKNSDIVFTKMCKQFSDKPPLFCVKKYMYKLQWVESNYSLSPDQYFGNTKRLEHSLHIHLHGPSVSLITALINLLLSVLYFVRARNLRGIASGCFRIRLSLWLILWDKTKQIYAIQFFSRYATVKSNLVLSRRHLK